MRVLSTLAAMYSRPPGHRALTIRLVDVGWDCTRDRLPVLPKSTFSHGSISSSRCILHILAIPGPIVASTCGSEPMSDRVLAVQHHQAACYVSFPYRCALNAQLSRCRSRTTLHCASALQRNICYLTA